MSSTVSLRKTKEWSENEIFSSKQCHSIKLYNRNLNLNFSIEWPNINYRYELSVSDVINKIIPEIHADVNWKLHPVFWKRLTDKCCINSVLTNQHSDITLWRNSSKYLKLSGFHRIQLLFGRMINVLALLQ